ncbi:hypothetical protein AB0B57_33965 [Micromonospora sp. NPDC049101]|uniref:hypothetical protein n=1 Tax=Micromonospora sp. NPDC049101 TaxID=3155032 RepID=UPI0033C50C8A
MKARHPSASGHQLSYELREIVNAIFHRLVADEAGCGGPVEIQILAGQSVAAWCE